MVTFEDGDSSLSGIRERTLRQAGRFSWDKCARQTLEIYEKYLD